MLSKTAHTQSGKTVRPAIGISYADFGNKVKYDHQYEPENEAPSFTQFGFSIQVVKPSEQAPRGKTRVRPPVWRFTYNSDIWSSKHNKHHRLATGMELGLHDIGFLRFGAETYGDTEHFTFGLGVGYNTGTVWFRVDYGRLPVWRMYRGAYPLDFMGISAGYLFG